MSSSSTCSQQKSYWFPAECYANQKQTQSSKKTSQTSQKSGCDPATTSARLRNAHQAVADIRADALHKLTSWLAKNHSTIVIEDLNVSGMLKNRNPPL
ncbi:transposase [Okeania sp. SIO3B5]|uniref:transposase n=1 Tax=Okeania sp. SIO3B5 TaxID=2607811 RepID=UPI0025E2F2AF|nr:transposase [Okeania sp. SIO3B5]